MKIFGIGLGRTGTKSLNRALRQLGLNVHHYPDDSITAGEVVSGRPLSLLDRCDGITDLHAATRFRELDARYPGSKFILTTRPLPTWLESCRVHFNWYKANPDPQPIAAMSRTLHILAYGQDDFDAEAFTKADKRHTRSILDYFHYTANLLRLDIVSGGGWAELCPFLGVPIPERSFPHTR